MCTFEKQKLKARARPAPSAGLGGCPMM
jgi:hypothetical protein